MNIRNLYKLFLEYPKICTDSRSVIKNSIFFALSGDNFNGNKFAKQAIENGCAYAITDDEQYSNHQNIILVQDSLKTLQELAKYHRKKLNIPFIGITGTNGKTTSKELIHAVLSSQYKTHATKGNLNNHIGVPLSILETNNKTEISIIEMGANHQNEINLLSNIAQPNYGIITNIGKAHLKGFGNIEGVIKAKSELYKYIKKNKQQIFLNQDDKTLVELAKGIKHNTYGTKANTSGFLLENNLFTEVKYKNKTINTKLIGDYQFYNVMLAICVGEYFNISLNNIKKSLETYTPKNNRSEIIKTQNNTLILDAYNANPSSMKAMITSFAKKKYTNKVCILGDMLELGEFSNSSHKEIDTLITKLGVTTYYVGREFKKNNQQAYISREEFEKKLIKKPIIGKTILIKGSRSIQLEKLITFL